MQWLKNLFGRTKASQHLESARRTVKIRGGSLSLVPVSLPTAKSEWEKRRKTATGTLVILLDPDDHFEMREDAETEDPLAVLAEATSVNIVELFEHLQSETALDEEEDPEENAEFLADRAKPDPASLRRTAQPAQTFSGMQFAKQAFLADVPCAEPWQVLAYWAFGGWNSVPYDPQLTAICKSWYERFGAVPALISGDIIEFWLDKPVTDPVVASELAMEMYYLCPDIVDQGVETTKALAESILSANVWYFWWD